MSQVDIPILEHADTRQALNQLMWEASDAILAIYESSDLGITTKDDQSPVTKADLTAHHVLVTGLSALTPDIPIMSEEDPDSLKIPETHSLYWLIDPLDGTKEFIQRNGEFTCNLALIDSNRTVYLQVEGQVWWLGSLRSSEASLWKRRTHGLRSSE